MRALVSLAGTFDVEFEVNLAGTGIKDFVDDNLSSRYIPTSLKAPYVRYVTFAKPCIKQIAMPFALERLRADGGTGKSLGIFHLDLFVLYSSKPHGVDLMVNDAD